MNSKLIASILLLLVLNTGWVVACGNTNGFRIDNGSCVLQDDPLNGAKKEYYANGKIRREYFLKEGKINGSYKFYDQLGHLVSDQYYKDGEPNGYMNIYYPSGLIKSEGNMKPGGDISGQAREYYQNGTLKSESMISGQAPNYSTQSKIYDEDGKLVSESSISNGEFVNAVTYDKEGRVTSEQKPGQIISYWYERDTGKKHTSINGVEQK